MALMMKACSKTPANLRAAGWGCDLAGLRPAARAARARRHITSCIFPESFPAGWLQLRRLHTCTAIFSAARGALNVAREVLLHTRVSYKKISAVPISRRNSSRLYNIALMDVGLP